MLQYMGGPKSLTPQQIYFTFESTAFDMDDPKTTIDFDTVFDSCTGYGLVDAVQALYSLPPPPTPVASVAPMPVTARSNASDRTLQCQ